MTRVVVADRCFVPDESGAVDDVSSGVDGVMSSLASHREAD
jgi:hypothetical protein